ncbi:hypothetical protein [Flavobacterium sp.]|uniref:hypothetical protein n=1 Tax=Flavobacterium sp. TaxID=239 RepID=UPI003264EC5B
MKNKIIKLRGFLKRNKIFFEVLAATALTITSIFVSFKANNISERQMEIMESENTPRIEIQRTQLFIDSTKTHQVSKWLVFNNNSKISNFEIEKQVSFLNVNKKDDKEITIPIIEYLNPLGKLSSQNEGLIYQFDNIYSFQDESATRQELLDYGDVNVRSFIEISYHDVLGRKKGIKYFQVSPLIQEILKDEWDSINEDWSSKSNDAIYLKYIEKNIQQIKNYYTKDLKKINSK